MTAGEGQPPRARRTWDTVDGIVLLDKPAGISSNRALQQARRLLNAARAGHAGTLDPLATGMLPLCFGQATRTCGSLLDAGKAYRATLSLGRSTSTGDAEGPVTGTAPVPSLDVAATSAALRGFEGEQWQVPPMHSALKHAGRALYRIAREGGEVERQPRRIVVRRCELRRCAPDEIEFDVECSKGTYVRVLGEAIARRLGTVGHLSSLRRLWVEPFQGEPMVTLDTLGSWRETQRYAPGPRPAWLLPVDAALRTVPRVDLQAGQARALRQGRVVSLPGAPPGHCRAYDPDGQFLGLVDVDAAGIARVRRFVVGAPPADGDGGS